jgi:hypothetical protein
LTCTCSWTLSAFSSRSAREASFPSNGLTRLLQNLPRPVRKGY